MSMHTSALACPAVPPPCDHEALDGLHHLVGLVIRGACAPGGVGVCGAGAGVVQVVDVVGPGGKGGRRSSRGGSAGLLLCVRGGAARALGGRAGR